MNFSDSEIVASILANEGFNTTQNLEDADLVLVNTFLSEIKQNKPLENVCKNTML